jgi:hypothetical protein
MLIDMHRLYMKIVAFSAYTFLNIHVLTAQEIEPIDSLYQKAAVNFSQNLSSIKGKAWPGMEIGPFCIFRLNGPAFLMNHPDPPIYAKKWQDSIYFFNQADNALMGTSQTAINNYLTAHNNYGQSFYVSENQFFAELFHELHHVYQRNHLKKLQFDNPVELLSYPEDYRNDAIKQYENELLLEMVTGSQTKFRENLNKLFSCRTLRQEIIGSQYITYEKRVESAEGPATYCEYMYMKEFSTTVQEQEYINKRFFYSLIEPTYGREGLRNKHLLIGMMQCLLLSRNFKNWQTDYYNSELPLIDYFFLKFKPEQVKLPPLYGYQAKAKYFTTAEKEKHKQNLEVFNSQNGLRITLLFNKSPDFKGFDPMHAEAINDSLILHSTLLKLGKGNNYLNVSNHRTVTQIDGQVWFVKSVTFYVPESTIRIDKKVFICNKENVSIHWQFLKQVRGENEYIITLE